MLSGGTNSFSSAPNISQLAISPRIHSDPSGILTSKKKDGPHSLRSSLVDKPHDFEYVEMGGKDGRLATFLPFFPLRTKRRSATRARSNNSKTSSAQSMCDHRASSVANTVISVIGYATPAIAAVNQISSPSYVCMWVSIHPFTWYVKTFVDESEGGLLSFC